MRRTKIYTILAILWSVACYGQQEQLYTQFMFNKLSLNPGYASQNDYTEVMAIYRDQWNGIPGAPTAQLVSASLPRVRDNIGLGFHLQRQSIGISSKTSLSGVYAYKFQLSKGTISMGIQASAKNYVIDFADSRLIATQGLEIDPSIPAERMSRTLANVGFGVYYNHGNYYFGLSSPTLLKGNIDFDQNDFESVESRQVYAMGGASFRIARKLQFNPQMLIKWSEVNPFDMDINLGLAYDERYIGALNFRVGGSYKDLGESVSLLFAFQVTPKFMLGFSHDFTLSQLRNQDNGSIEVVAGFTFGKEVEKVKMVNPRYF